MVLLSRVVAKMPLRVMSLRYRWSVARPSGEVGGPLVWLCVSSDGNVGIAMGRQWCRGMWEWERWHGARLRGGLSRDEMIWNDVRRYGGSCNFSFRLIET